MSLYDRLFKPRRYTLPNGAVVEEKRSRAPLVILIVLALGALSVHITGFDFGVLVKKGSKFFDILLKQGIKGIVGSHIPLGAVGSFQLTNVNTVQLPFVQIPRLMSDLVRRFFQPFRSVGLIAIQPQTSPNCLPGGVLGLNAGILTCQTTQK